MANFYYRKYSYTLLRISLKSVALNTFFQINYRICFLFSLSHEWHHVHIFKYYITVL